ncbi:hypothetical protein [Flavobacterium sp. N1736]|uniref:hypothetical protein n=1 Tax=Flavobacterium sp. N1736 TaxID=2986823 RepID=UPI002224F0EE|nr:hypothetical protein [Flavobacterium sp. N1736]
MNKIYSIFTELNISTVVNILSGVGTFISSIIALFALKEVMKQRRAMYQPKLYLNEFTLAVKGNPFLENRSFYYFHLHNLHEPVNKNDTSGFSIMAQFFFENIGYGVASKIEYQWNFDYKKALKEICNIDSDFNYRIDKSDKSIVITKNNEYYSSYNFDDLNIIKKTDFIKPESLQKNIKPTTIPIIITSLYMDYVMTKNKMYSEVCQSFRSEEFIDFPSLELELSYEDIAGKRYKMIYNFKLNCSNSFNQKNLNSINTKEEFANLCFYIK